MTLQLPKLPQLNRNLAIIVTMHYLFVLFICIGVAASLAFIVTAKWYMVLVALAVLCAGWFILYKLEEGITKQEKSQDATTPAPAIANFKWSPGLK
jgi:hypothetical protein